ncbi:MAG: hypothetical protein HZC40_25600 [Chloroflexi bacterium]|nr:hypothetical protein [Chloroflexota bacterium]
MHIRFALLVLVTLVACATPQAAPPTQPPLPTVGLPTLVLPTPIPPTRTPTLAPTSAPSPTLLVPTAASMRPGIAVTATPLIAPTATRVPPTPTIAVAPGLYVTNLRTVPDPPVRGEIEFHATFLNATSAPQNYRWVVFIYKADAPNKSFGQTTQTTSAIPLGTSEQKSLGSWRLGPGGGCEFFFARVAFFNESNNPIPFTAPNGKVFEKTFSLC